MTDEINKESVATFNKQRAELLDAVYGGGHKVTLYTGRTITMSSIRQSLTYGGMIEGVPRSKEIYDYEINPRIDDRTYILHAPVREWDLFKNLPESPNSISYYIENPPITLPRIKCSANFNSGPIVREGIEENGISFIDLVWYQHEWAMPIAPEVMERLKAFDWDNLACFGEI